VYNSIRNFNTWGHVIYELFPFLFTLFVWIPLASSVAYIIVLSLTIATSILICVFYWRIRNSTILASANSIFNKHPKTLMIIVLIIVYLLSIILFVTTFNQKFDWVLWPKDIYEGIWGINLSKTKFNYGINIASWLVVLLFSISILIYWLVKRFKFVDKPYLMLSAFSILLFINPLSLNIFSRLQQSSINLFDFGLINYLVIIPLLAYTLNLIGNKSQYRKEQTLYGQNINQN
jgi:hypothetical protein